MTLGWWIVPTIVSGGCYYIFRRLTGHLDPGGGNYGVDALLMALCMLALMVPALIAWLIWALAT